VPRKPPPKRPHRHSVGSSVMDGNGYPTALTPARHAQLITELRKGDWPAMAAIRADVSPRSMERWVVTGCDPFAVEPYKSFAGAFVKVEAELSGEMMGIILDHARSGHWGNKRPPKGDPGWARWVLENRFRFLWRLDKEGRAGGVSVLEVVVAAIDKLDMARSEKARELLKQLTTEQKQAAIKEGFQL
jgi:hypothetical protein